MSKVIIIINIFIISSEICYLLFLHDIFGDTYRPNLKTKSNIVLWFTSLCEQHDSAVLSAQWCSAHSGAQHTVRPSRWKPRNTGNSAQ